MRCRLATVESFALLTPNTPSQKTPRAIVPRVNHAPFLSNLIFFKGSSLIFEGTTTMNKAEGLRRHGRAMAPLSSETFAVSFVRPSVHLKTEVLAGLAAAVRPVR